MSDINKQLEELQIKQQELLKLKEEEKAIKALMKIEEIFVPGIINITQPKTIKGCSGCDYKEFEDGGGYIDEYYRCSIGGGRLYSHKHPIGAPCTLDCPCIKPDAKEKYIKQIKEAIKQLQDILVKIDNNLEKSNDNEQN